MKWSKWHKTFYILHSTFYRLNVFKEEHKYDITDFVFDGSEESGSRHINLPIADLQEELSDTRRELSASRKHSLELETSNNPSKCTVFSQFVFIQEFGPICSECMT